MIVRAKKTVFPAGLDDDTNELKHNIDIMRFVYEGEQINILAEDFDQNGIKYYDILTRHEKLSFWFFADDFEVIK